MVWEKRKKRELLTVENVNINKNKKRLKREEILSIKEILKRSYKTSLGYALQIIVNNP